MISAPNKTMQSIQATINSRILSPVTMIHPAAVGFRNGHSVVDNANPHLGKRYVLKMDIHDFFFSIRSPRVKRHLRRSVIRKMYLKYWERCVVCTDICRRERLQVRR